jgi:hypothetical protein
MDSNSFNSVQDRFEILSEYDSVLTFRDMPSALQFLSRFRNDSAQMAALRSFLIPHMPGVQRMTADQIVRHAAQLLVRGKLRLLQHYRTPTLRQKMDVEAAAATTESAAPAATTKKTWVEFRVVDDETGKPIQGIELTIKLPDGRIEKQKTNEGGFVEINDTAEGECEVSCDFSDAKMSNSYAYIRLGDR